MRVHERKTAINPIRRADLQTSCRLSREGLPLTGPGEVVLKSTTISAKAMPTAIPRFLASARKLEARPTFSLGSEPMMALLLAGAKRAIPIP